MRLSLVIALLAGSSSLALGQEAGPIVITEIMYNPAGVDEGQEWVEIYNPTSSPVSVSRWRLQDDDGQTDRFPTGTTLAPGAVAVVVPIRGGVLGNGTQRRSTYVNNAAAFSAAWGPGVQVIFVDSFWNYPADPVPAATTLDGLSNSPSATNEQLRLINDAGIVIDRVDYDDDEDIVTPWPDDNDGGSIQLLREFVGNISDNNNGAAWRLSSPGDALGSRHAAPGAITFSGLNSYGTPGQLASRVTTDCNANGQSDAFDIVRGVAFDAYPYNNIPDSCESDCNSNLVGDLTEISLDWQLDRDLSRTLDSCDINAAGGAGGFGGSRDANANGILDSFESKPDVVITEIMYNPAGADEGQEWVEVYNAGVIPVDVSGWALKDVEGDPATGGIALGTILQPQEAIVLVPGSGPGVPADIVSQFCTAWALPASVRVLPLTPWQDRAQQATDIDEVLGLIDASGEIVDVVNYQNREYVATSAWPDDDGDSSITLQSDGLTKSANDMASHWVLSTSGLNGARDSAQFGVFNDGRLTGSVGSPGTVWTQMPQQASGQVIFTELMYSPNSNPGDTTRGEWVELYNTTMSTVDLSGWYLRDEDGRTSSIPAGTSLAPHSAIILTARGTNSSAAAEANFRAAWGEVCQVIALTGWSDQDALPNLGGLANSPSLGNELLTLRTSDGSLVDIVNFDDASPWPADAASATPGLGAAWSIYLRAGFYDANANDDGGNWSPSSIGFDLAEINLVTPVYNGIDIASPGVIAEQVLTQSCAAVACDDIDFNSNGVFPEDQDVSDFFNVLAGADCPVCHDIDFNNNGVFPEDADVIDFFNVLAGGSCP